MPGNWCEPNIRFWEEGLAVVEETQRAREALRFEYVEGLYRPTPALALSEQSLVEAAIDRLRGLQARTVPQLPGNCPDHHCTDEILHRLLLRLEAGKQVSR